MIWNGRPNLYMCCVDSYVLSIYIVGLRQKLNDYVSMYLYLVPSRIVPFMFPHHFLILDNCL
jgi:hypothetical protein